MVCICLSLDLFRLGCLCGAFQREKSNHLWFNGKIYVIAKNEDEAVELAEKELSAYADFTPMWILGDGRGWHQISDDEMVTLSFSDLSTHSRTAFDWTELYKEGYLASA